MSGLWKKLENASNKMDCVFCRIIQKQIPSEIIYEDEYSLAFLDIHPRAPGHALVIPKIHAPNILEIEDRSLIGLITAVKKTVALISKALMPAGFTIGINHGKISGQEVDHLHIHILPRFEGDRGSSIQSAVLNPPEASLQEIANKIKNA